MKDFWTDITGVFHLIESKIEQKLKISLQLNEPLHKQSSENGKIITLKDIELQQKKNTDTYSKVFNLRHIQSFL